MNITVPQWTSAASHYFTIFYHERSSDYSRIHSIRLELSDLVSGGFCILTPVLISLIPPAASLPRPSWPTRCSLIVHERFWFDALAHSVCLAKIAISFYLHILLISPYLWHCSSLVSLFVDHSNYMWHSCLRAPVYFFVSTAHPAW